MSALAGKTAIVTGASRGIGRGIAERLARDGALVAVHYGRSEAAARETVRAIEEAGGRAFAVHAELEEPDAVDTFYAALDAGLAERGAGPGFDILVNNAAASGSGRIHELTGEVFDRLFAINVKAPLFLVQRGLDRLSDGGRIVNISSAATKRAFPESVTYVMTKGAVDTMTPALAKELAPRGITVNSVAPGYVATDMNAHRRTTPEASAALAAHSVLNRLGTPADIADVVAFLVSDDARWITGQCVDVSGGYKL
ncbi:MULTISPECIES: glucose 1-dehydrogenase [Streptomyces]|jgi:3-oxoacyl-[acyl-carrier protein] reductase|uniref:3-oxoacyl-[acyl-carrier protein] reductase n=1 Tax=Streptomyces nymphaeiformis TaxID=2663842 RepID=A0A7W7XEB7_9ACTN|nr:glucose 1-dehydrogenase [Streptomyces nymphaeiformis]MBB4984346.1 3-oxoacyl-[acyl-carrier protein] reductase [Streptomyces nymphaeiformis]